MSTRVCKKKTNLFHSDVETRETAPVIMCTLPNNDHRSSIRSEFIFGRYKKCIYNISKNINDLKALNISYSK